MRSSRWRSFHQPIWSCLARRKNSWMSYSSVKPTPPKICWAVAVTSRNVLAREQLGHRRELRRPAGRWRGPRPPRGRACWRRRAGLGVGQVVGDRLERAEGLVELLAVLGVLDGDLQGVARRRRRPRPRAGSCRRRTAVPRRPAGARRRRSGRRRRPARRRGRPGTACRRPIVELLGERDAGRRRVDEEQVDGIVGVAGAGQHEQPGRPTRRRPRGAWSPVSTKPSPSVAARPAAARPGDRSRRPASSHAGERIASPATISRAATRPSARRCRRRRAPRRPARS